MFPKTTISGNETIDYSLFTANTGVGRLITANSNLNGSGPVTIVFTAGDNGAIVRTIIIKALQSVTPNMVRLFISNSDESKVTLYREIPIPIYPVLTSTPTPAPLYPTLEIDLIDNLKLEAGYKLLASTQTAQSINVIVEGLDWSYPAPASGNMYNFITEFGSTGLGTVSVANPNLDGTGTLVDIFTAPANNGSLIQSITIAALQSTYTGMVRLFVKSGVTSYLFAEVTIPQTNQSSFQPSFKTVLKDTFFLQAGFKIAASTQYAESFAISVEAVSWRYEATT